MFEVKERKKPFWCDLHMHSNHSDGLLSRREVLEKVVRENNGDKMAIAFTDHNTPILDYEVEELEKDFPNIKIVKGSEISVTYKGREIHVIALAYRDDSAFLRMLKLNKKNKKNYVEAILEKLKSIGIDLHISYEQLLEKVAPSDHVGRMCIAREMVEQKYVRDIDEAFDEYLGSFGKKRAFVESPYKYIELEVCVSKIKSAGGIAVLCHPLFYNLNDSELRLLIRKFKEAGGDAIESEYAFYQKEQREKLRKLSEEYNLAISAGSDFHNPNERLNYHFDGEIYEKLMK